MYPISRLPPGTPPPASLKGEGPGVGVSAWAKYTNLETVLIEKLSFAFVQRHHIGQQQR